MTTVFTTRRPSNLSLCLKVKGHSRAIRFSPPVYFGIAYESTFSTDDADIVDAMMKHPDFNVCFFIKEKLEDRATRNTETKVKSIEEELLDPTTAVYNDTVTTKSMAVAYIQGNFEETFSSTSVDEMKREAARRWNVIFTKWGK